MPVRLGPLFSRLAFSGNTEHCITVTYWQYFSQWAYLCDCDRENSMKDTDVCEELPIGEHVIIQIYCYIVYLTVEWFAEHRTVFTAQP